MGVSESPASRDATPRMLPGLSHSCHALLHSRLRPRSSWRSTSRPSSCAWTPPSPPARRTCPSGCTRAVRLGRGRGGWAGQWWAWQRERPWLRSLRPRVHAHTLRCARHVLPARRAARTGRRTFPRCACLPVSASPRRLLHSCVSRAARAGRRALLHLCARQVHGGGGRIGRALAVLRREGVQHGRAPASRPDLPHQHGPPGCRPAPSCRCSRPSSSRSPACTCRRQRRSVSASTRWPKSCPPAPPRVPRSVRVPG